MSTDTPDLDARGLRCPLPVIRLAQRARHTPPGDRVVVWADDPAARSDIPAWARLKGHEVVIEDVGTHQSYTVTLGSGPATTRG